MSEAHTQRFCKTCERQSLHAKPTTGGGEGCLMILAATAIGILMGSLGLALGVVVLAVIVLLAVNDCSKPWRCQVCGGTN